MGETAKPNGRSKASYVLIVAFVAATWMPMADMIFGLAPRPALSENRQMAPFPKFGWRAADLRMFQYELKPYLRDNFGFRPMLIHAYHVLKAHLLGVSSSPQVVLGKEGWLFYAGENVIEDYRCVKPYKPGDLDAMRQILEGERDWLAQREVPIQYLVVIVPNNHTLYPEYLPDWVTRVRNKSRLDQLMAHMEAKSTLKILDLRPVLLDGKQHMRVSCRTDTHWNDYGAFLGYRAIMERLNAWFPGVHPLELDAFTIKTEMLPGGDLAGMIDARNQRLEESIELIPRAHRQAILQKTQKAGRSGRKLIPAITVSQVPQPGLPRAVMFRDSSATALAPFLSEHFSRIAYVWDKRFDRRIIEAEKPQVVIRELTERFLMHDPANFTEQAGPSQSDDAGL